MSKRTLWPYQDDQVRERWEYGENRYVIRELPEVSKAGVKWCLDFVHIDCTGGGGIPFSTREELDAYVERFNLRPVTYEQTRLF